MAQSTKRITLSAYAKRKMMDLLSKREHSEAELRSKLIRAFRKYDQPVTEDEATAAIDLAVIHAIDQGWLVAPGILSAKKAADLHKKLKGIGYINQYLAAKGLPEVGADWDLELEKALTLVKNKTFQNTDKTRAARLLESRGFDEETVRKVLHEKF